MKHLLLIGALLPCLVVAAAEAPPPSMPAEVTLTSGRVLRHVTVVRWEKDRVVLRYAAGIDPIAFSLFKVPAPAELPAIRAAMTAEVPTPAVATPKLRNLAGQVSGLAAKGTVILKYSGAPVRAFEIGQWTAAVERERASLPENFPAMSTAQRHTAVANAWNEAVKDLPAIASATTDTEGNFALALPVNREVFVLCSAWHRVGKIQEAITWAVPAGPDLPSLELNDTNQFAQPE